MVFISFVTFKYSKFDFLCHKTKINKIFAHIITFYVHPILYFIIRIMNLYQAYICIHILITIPSELLANCLRMYILHRKHRIKLTATHRHIPTVLFFISRFI